MKKFIHITYPRLFLAICLLGMAHSVRAKEHPVSETVCDSVPPQKAHVKKGIAKYFNIVMDRQQRDSLLVKLGRQNATTPPTDSVVWQRRQNNFTPYAGKVIRAIYYNQLKVFGTQIEDTTVASTKLIRFANRLHYDTKIWMLRQSLFFREGDTVNAFKLADNERYLRNLAFIQDARLYVINTYQNSDSIDIVLVSKDLFEYGGSLTSLSNTSAAATAYNTNLLGAGQRVFVGFKWDNPLSPQWRTGVGYTKYNLGGSFADVAVGYSVLNDRSMADTGVYERSYYLSVNRPLYSTWAKFTGGFTLALNTSINIYDLQDTVYRSYQYSIVDLWGGYNFRNQIKSTGYNSKKPDLGVELRRYSMDFSMHPVQEKLKQDPNYNDHDYLLAKLVLFHQDFFKTNYFFGFGRTEDIPLGYNASVSYGLDNWVGRKRTYTALEGQRFWLPGKNLINSTIGVGGFWYNGKAEDVVLHLQTDYYSNLFRLKGPRLREFLHGDYLICFNPTLYKPVNINRENNIIGYRNTQFTGYQRLNVSAQTNYYSPLNIYGFKFNFYAQVQTSLLTGDKESIFKSPLYSGFSLGCQIRNENLALNTLQISLSYQPNTPNPYPASYGPKRIFLQINSITTFGFNIFALQAPSLIQFR